MLATTRPLKTGKSDAVEFTELRRRGAVIPLVGIAEGLLIVLCRYPMQSACVKMAQQNSTKLESRPSIRFRVQIGSGLDYSYETHRLASDGECLLYYSTGQYTR